MKKLFAVLLTIVALALILAVYITGSDRSSSGSGTERADQNDLAKKAPVFDTAFERTPAGEQDSTQAAEQILTDISDANVSESTGDLKLAFNRLNKLCERAVRMRDAMLSAKFDDRETGAVSGAKGPENGGE